ncbi:hypothetical protein D1007_52551 [Hordeum vulgare]|nr:hypothetical protein D1007_52551 [Hordeum vulgare]
MLGAQHDSIRIKFRNRHQSVATIVLMLNAQVGGLSPARVWPRRRHGRGRVVTHLHLGVRRHLHCCCSQRRRCCVMPATCDPCCCRDGGRRPRLRLSADRRVFLRVRLRHGRLPQRHGCAACRAPGPGVAGLTPLWTGSPEDARRLCGGYSSSRQRHERLCDGRC